MLTEVVSASFDARLPCSILRRRQRTSAGVAEGIERAAPANLHWADIADSDADSEEEAEAFFAPAARATATAGASTRTSTSTWRPNLSAPDFVPTLTMVCPLVGFCEVEGGEVCQAWTELPMDMLPPCSVGPRLAAPAPAAGGLGQEPRREQRRRRSSVTKALEPTRAPIDEDCEKHVTEEEWQNRIQARVRAVDLGKATREYRCHAEAKARVETTSAGERARTPDPEDRTCSRRHWKYEVSHWRAVLRRLYGEAEDRERSGNGSSVASTEEWQSRLTALTEAGDDDGEGSLRSGAGSDDWGTEARLETP